MRRRERSEENVNTDRWLLTYSDMMNNLLVLFIVLYAMSIMDMSKFEALARELNNTFSNVPMTDAYSFKYDTLVPLEQSLGTEVNAAGRSEGSQDNLDRLLDQAFNQVYSELQEKIKEMGYEELVKLEKGDDYIKFRFGDNVLFYPDSPQIKSGNIEVLSFIGEILKEIDPLTETIEIGGHTATTGEPTTSFFSWELSSQRSISVLKYLVQKCQLSEAKMSISGYSRYRPVADNDTEENRQLNRRVEIKVTRMKSVAQGGTAVEPPGH